MKMTERKLILTFVIVLSNYNEIRIENCRSILTFIRYVLILNYELKKTHTKRAARNMDLLFLSSFA